MWIKHRWQTIALFQHADCRKARYDFVCIYCLQSVPDEDMTLHYRQCSMVYSNTRRRRQTLYRCMRCFGLHSHLQLLTPPRHTCRPYLWDVAPRISKEVTLLWWEKTMNAEPRIPHSLLERHRRWYNSQTHVWESYEQLYGEWLYHAHEGIFYH